MKNETKYYGLHACLAIWKSRPQDVVRVYLEESLVKTLSPLLKWCAQQKKAYHIIPSFELDRVSDSIHHEGICLLAKDPPPATFDSLRPLPRCLLYLDGIQNPHNLGSIIRSAAHFGLPALLGHQLPALSPSCCRVAKGGAESVRLIEVENPVQLLQMLKKKGYAIIGTSSHAKESLYPFAFPPLSILLVGSESHGISRPLQSLVTHSIRIPGSGAVESLNVSVATALCLGEYSRQHP